MQLGEGIGKVRIAVNTLVFILTLQFAGSSVVVLKFVSICFIIRLYFMPGPISMELGALFGCHMSIRALHKAIIMSHSS
jgi:ABC-type anion transport system duplicated permease subunit